MRSQSVCPLCFLRGDLSCLSLTLLKHPPQAKQAEEAAQREADQPSAAAAAAAPGTRTSAQTPSAAATTATASAAAAPKVAYELE